MKCNTEVYTQESLISKLTPLAAVVVDEVHPVHVQPKLATVDEEYNDVLVNEVPLGCEV